MGWATRQLALQKGGYCGAENRGFYCTLSAGHPSDHWDMPYVGAVCGISWPRDGGSHWAVPQRCTAWNQPSGGQRCLLTEGHTEHCLYGGKEKDEPPKATHPTYRFNEEATLKELKDYIDSTYGGHYAGKDGTQSIDLTISAGHGVGFCVGNILKYARRYGKKAGQERRDVFKILHYAVLLLYLTDKGKN